MPLMPFLAQMIAPDLLASARSRLAATQPCAAHTNNTDVTVCGRRAADRFRVPFLVVTPGNPAHEGVPAERERLLHRTRPIDDMGPFLIGGGAAGVQATVGNSGPVHVATLRAPAP